MLTAELEIEGTEIAEIFVGEGPLLGGEQFESIAAKFAMGREQRAEFAEYVRAEIRRTRNAEER